VDSDDNDGDNLFASALTSKPTEKKQTKPQEVCVSSDLLEILALQGL